MINRFQQFNTLFPKEIFRGLRYIGVITIVFWIVFKLFAIESLLQDNQRALFKNSVSWLYQQTRVGSQLNRLENKLMAVQNANSTYRALGENINACRTQLDAMKAVLEQIQTQTAPSAILSALKSAQSSGQHAVNTSLKTDRIPAPSKSLKHTIHRLPFDVLNIDSWNGECLVMVNHHGHIDLLSQHDTLAGWQVAKIDFDAGWVRFKHPQGNSMRVFV